jgi:hypothetical protein
MARGNLGQGLWRVVPSQMIGRQLHRRIEMPALMSVIMLQMYRPHELITLPERPRTYPFQEDTCRVCAGFLVLHNSHGAFEMAVYDIRAASLDKLRRLSVKLLLNNLKARSAYHFIIHQQHDRC